MLTDRAEGLMQFSRVTKYAATAVSCLMTAGLTAADGSFVFVLRAALLPAIIMFLALLAFGPSWYSWGRTCFRHRLRTAVRLTITDSIQAGLSLIVGIALMPAGTAGIVSPGPCILSATVSLFLLNRFLPGALAAVMFRGPTRPRALVLGPPGAMEMIRHQLHLAEAVRLEILDGSEVADSTSGLRIFDPGTEAVAESGRIAIVSRIHQPDQSHAVDRVIFVRSNSDSQALKEQQEIQHCCNEAGLPLTVFTAARSTEDSSVIPTPADNPVIRPVAQEPLQNPVNQAVKRSLDILIAVPFVMFVLPPLCLLVRFFHGIQSPGPLFYRQERCGKLGSTFHILKFRTMHAPAPGQTDLEDDPAPRIFALGSILRDSRLDEIPQFLNVLSGAMSIVGPRAHHVQDRIKFSRLVTQYPMRTQVKPGITGPAQYKEYRGVFLRDSVGSRVACDLNYISRWTILTDLILMLKTGRVIAESLFRAGQERVMSPSDLSASVVTPRRPALVSVSGGDSLERCDQRTAA